jgi:5'-methylthioadenosine phosphorylase
LPGLEQIHEETVDTPFGQPSSPIVTGTIGATRLAFLARHGRGHTLSPSEVPYRANLFALRMIGATHLLSISAVGSLQEAYPPGSAVVPDQIIDRTVHRDRSFFDGGVVAHVGLADPFCSSMRRDITRHVTGLGTVADEGTYLCIEGPQFSTRAESLLYRSWNCAVVGMTAMPEARLAREAGLCYGMLAMVTDYDVWHESEADVSVELLQQVLAANVDVGREVIRRIARAGLPVCSAGCIRALDGAIITAPDHVSPAAAERVALFAR